VTTIERTDFSISNSSSEPWSTRRVPVRTRTTMRTITSVIGRVHWFVGSRWMIVRLIARVVYISFRRVDLPPCRARIPFPPSPPFPFLVQHCPSLISTNPYIPLTMPSNPPRDPTDDPEDQDLDDLDGQSLLRLPPVITNVVLVVLEQTCYLVSPNHHQRQQCRTRSKSLQSIRTTRTSARTKKMPRRRISKRP
jgi:hypothetical protein